MVGNHECRRQGVEIRLWPLEKAQVTRPAVSFSSCCPEGVRGRLLRTDRTARLVITIALIG
jgi:hypothetical protein